MLLDLYIIFSIKVQRETLEMHPMTHTSSPCISPTKLYEYWALPVLPNKLVLIS